MNTTDVKTRLAGQRDLEMNHTHYLMLDDGTVRYYDLKDFRTHLAIQLSKLHEDNQMGSMFCFVFDKRNGSLYFIRNEEYVYLRSNTYSIRPSYHSR